MMDRGNIRLQAVQELSQKRMQPSLRASLGVCWMRWTGLSLNHSTVVDWDWRSRGKSFAVEDQ